MRDPMWVDDTNAPSTSNLLSRVNEAVTGKFNPRFSGENVFNLLTRREIAPRSKRSTKRLWRRSSEGGFYAPCHISEAGRDARSGLISWVEAESLHHLSAKYCPLLPPPRSTIAAAFSPDGKTLASTHGDHTVKIIDFQSGNCLKVLSGHRRTPWVVRFHPTCPGLLASGSLDHEVRLWDANTAECIGSRDFYRPIASIAFHAQGELLAVASGHKLYIWHYNERGEMSIPTVVLKTRRSLRAVHFHPHAAPFLLTAEVNDLDSSDSSMTLATSQGAVEYPPPTVYVANVHPSDWSSSAEELPLMSLPVLIWPPLSRNDDRISFQHSDGNAGSSYSMHQRVGPSSSVRLLTYSTPSGQYELLLSPIEPSNSSSVPDEMRPGRSSGEMETTTPEAAIDAMETSEAQSGGRSTQIFSFGDPAYWDLPFLQGWFIGQSQAGQRMIRPGNSSSQELPSAQSEMLNPDQVASSMMQMSTTHARSSTRSSSRHRSSRSRAATSTSAAEVAAVPQDDGGPQPIISRFQSGLATSLAAAAAAELPCTVKLRIWPYDIKDPSAPLEADKCRLTIPHAVLCSEMGAHFSPCGRFLAACVACMLPQAEGESGIQMRTQHDASGAGTSPTRHPISAQPVMYELRIYSLEEATFGFVLASQAIRAAHCLTSIQFSPSSEHLLLAYGRRHNSLLKSIVFDGETTVPIYTILEVYRVSDMKLVRVLPSAEDEVNVACFHPSIGGGLVYGTKEGKLRILQYDNSNSLNCTASCFPDENLLEVPSHALEC